VMHFYSGPPMHFLSGVDIGAFAAVPKGPGPGRALVSRDSDGRPEKDRTRGARIERQISPSRQRYAAMAPL
jgi:hypothetical protein